MDETRYHMIADATLMHLADQLEDAYDNGTLDDLSHEGGILTIRAASGRIYLLSKHAPTRQLWLASPISGGLHFEYDNPSQAWQLADGRTLYALLRAELKSEGVEVVL